MTWKDRLRKASFRGVEFKVDISDIDGGRRAVKHEFPQKNIPFVEDMGGKSKTFPIEGYVIGDDYMDKRDLLMDALDKEGPALFVHPYHGELNLQVETWHVKEIVSDGGMARFSIVFFTNRRH